MTDSKRQKIEINKGLDEMAGKLYFSKLSICFYYNYFVRPGSAKWPLLSPHTFFLIITKRIPLWPYPLIRVKSNAYHYNEDIRNLSKTSCVYSDYIICSGYLGS